jgi:hypothetical protein
MIYHLSGGGADLGQFTLEELRTKRRAGLLTGAEFVWREEMPDWVALDTLLAVEASRSGPPPVPSWAAKRKSNPAAIWSIVAAVVACVVLVAVMARPFMIGLRQGLRQASRTPRPLAGQEPQAQTQVETQTAPELAEATNAVALASRPAVGNANFNLARADREFRERQWVEGYKTRGKRDTKCDAEALRFLQTWLARNFGEAVDPNLPSTAEWADKLAADPACVDPLVLAVAGFVCPERMAAGERLDRALSGFPNSAHWGYPKLYAAVHQSGHFANNSARRNELDEASLKYLQETLSDGSLRPDDQVQMAVVFLDGWAAGFFNRNAPAICQILTNSGKAFPWLSLMLAGQEEVRQAWQARGGGYVNTVSEAGWRGFADGLAAARRSFESAWRLRPDLPYAADRMIYVSLGDSGLPEMRQWFDRAVAAQFDYGPSWSNMRWGLRPRWHGDLDSMLAFGVMALNTRRFDTDVPRKFMDTVGDISSELGVKPGVHIYDRPEIWPRVREMYEGYIAYIATRTNAADVAGWRSSYAAVAYLAGQYGVSRTQLERLEWKPARRNLTGWWVDLSLMPEEVAARTGDQGSVVTRAEAASDRGALDEAEKLYHQVADTTGADERTKVFSQARLATLRVEKKLRAGEWVDFLPDSDDHPEWMYSWGKASRQPDGALEVEAGPEGHFLFSRAPVSPNFEVEGEFELVSSSTPDFQAGLIMGMPDCDSRLESHEWYSFRIKSNRFEGQAATFSAGWSLPQIRRKAAVNRARNTFSFQLRNGVATAAVNGQNVMSNTKPQRNISVGEGKFRLGLGAYNDRNRAVVRYRHVRVRLLDAGNGAGAR